MTRCKLCGEIGISNVNIKHKSWCATKRAGAMAYDAIFEKISNGGSILGVKNLRARDTSLEKK